MQMCVRSLPASTKTRPILIVLSSALSSGKVWLRSCRNDQYLSSVRRVFLKSGNDSHDTILSTIEPWEKTMRQ